MNVLIEREPCIREDRDCADAVATQGMVEMSGGNEDRSSRSQREHILDVKLLSGVIRKW